MRVLCLSCRRYFEAGPAPLPPFPPHVACPGEAAARPIPSPLATTPKRDTESREGYTPKVPITVEELRQKYGPPMRSNGHHTSVPDEAT